MKGAPRKHKVGVTDVYDYIALKLFSKLASWVAKTFELEAGIRRAGMTVYPTLYAARLLLAVAMAAAISIYATLMVAFSSVSFTYKVLVGASFLSFPILVFALGLSYPSYKAGDRKRWVESELPFFASYITAMAIAGLDVLNVLERVSRLNIFKGVRMEAQLILRDVRLLGKDPLKAIEDNALSHPSSQYRDFMLGYSATVKIGGSVVHYLEVKTEDIFRNRIDELKILSERVALYTELYIILAVISSISFYIFFTVSGLFPGSGFGGTSHMAIYSFVALPLITLTILYLVDRLQPKSPIKFFEPYNAIITYGIPAAIITLPLTLYITGSYKVLGGLIAPNLIIAASTTLSSLLMALSLPPAYYWIIESRRARGMGGAIASFLRDLTEARKTGLSPEKSIIALSTRDYGPLTPVVKKMSSALTIGLDVDKAVASAVKGYRNWVLLSTMRFLTDAITLGGGSVETLDSLARFARSLEDYEIELSRRLKIYMLMPYVGAIMVAGSSMMILGYTAQTLTISPQQAAQLKEQIGSIALILSLGSIINSWLMGLMAGKLSKGTIIAGFTHSIILVIITLTTIALTLRGVPVI